MANIVIYQKGSNQIQFFVKECIKEDNCFKGSNIELSGVNLSLFDFNWTYDVVNPIFDSEDNLIGYDKTLDQLTLFLESSDNLIIQKPDELEYKDAIKRRKDVSDFTYSQIDQYIDDNIIDLASAKTYLKKLSGVVLSICKQIDYERR